MQIVNILIATVLSLFSTAVMAYISMATPIGPWIAPTVVLCALILLRCVSRSVRSESVGLITAAGSVGGIIATAFGFSFPTLYFLDPALFNAWMETPVYFCAVVTGLSLSGSLLGLIIANYIEEQLIDKERLAFPIGQLVFTMITAADQHAQTMMLVIGFVVTTLLCICQDGIGMFKGFIPHAVQIIPAISSPWLHIAAINFDISPLWWSIGFITGHLIAIPLLVGACARIVVDLINHLFFPSVASVDFVLAFASGMVLFSTAQSFKGLPAFIKQTVQKYTHGERFSLSSYQWHTNVNIVELGVTLAIIVAFLTYFKFSLLAQLYMLFFTVLWTYQIAVIAGKIGIAPLGRFATFVMVPALLLFGRNFIHLVFISTFVELCGGVTADLLFSRKMGQLLGIPRKKIIAYQYLGIIVSSLALGVALWLLINHLELGSAQLFAQKAQMRQLLINVQTFNYMIMLLGMAFCWFLSWCRVNPMLTLGGILMPINLSLGLIVGACIAQLSHKREQWEPLWSGVFAANSLWMIIKAMV